MKSRTLIPLIVAIVMLAVCLVALGYPYFQAKLAFLFSAGIVTILSVVQLVKEVFGKGDTADPALEVSESHQEAGAKAYFRECAWLIGFAFGVYLLGFTIAIPVFGIAYMMKHGVNARTALAVSAGWTLFCWATFTFFLDSGLYLGLILERLDLF